MVSLRLIQFVAVRGSYVLLYTPYNVKSLTITNCEYGTRGKLDMIVFQFLRADIPMPAIAIKRVLTKSVPQT